MRLFAENGFDATTVDQIATSSGISRRSFFHYFGSKEDLVLGDTEALGETVRAALEARPAEEPAWAAIRAAFLALHAEKGMETDGLTVARMYHEAPSLRARHLEKHLRWQVLLAPDIQRRLGLPDSATPDPGPAPSSRRHSPASTRRSTRGANPTERPTPYSSSTTRSRRSEPEPACPAHSLGRSP